jgi:gamma-tubulin complex component 3
VAENVPSVLDSECARMIFSTGKAIHFLLNRCKVLYQVRTPFLDLSALADPAALLAGPFRTWLTALHAEVSRALVETLFGQFHLRHHLQSLKNFFLAGKGDFIQHLYDTLREKLSLKKQEITEHSLDGYISDAIVKCFNDFALPDGRNFRSSVADRLLAKKIEFGTGSEGWDCFNFQYSLERIEPLQVLFSPEAMLGYQKIFAFLWRVKQVDETLKAVWVAQGREEALRLRRTRSRQLQEVFHMAYLLRSAMLHCLSSLHSYLMVTLEAAWGRFSA